MARLGPTRTRLYKDHGAALQPRSHQSIHKYSNQTFFDASGQPVRAAAVGRVDENEVRSELDSEYLLESVYRIRLVETHPIGDDQRTEGKANTRMANTATSRRAR